MNYLETLKNIKKDSIKKKENLFFILALLVILLISINYIFNGDKSEKETTVEDNIKEQVVKKEDLEYKIAQILNQISGIKESSVVINYSNEGENSFAYNTRETLSEQGNLLSVERNIAYNESSGQKNAIIEIYNTPKVEGVIIVASGVELSDTKQKISNAIGNLLGIASYKVQVFEK